MDEAIELVDPVAEEGLLSVMMNDSSATLVALAMGITTKDFAYDSHSLLYETMLNLHRTGKKITADHVIGSLAGAGMAEAIPESEVQRIYGKYLQCEGASHYVNRIKDKSVRRRIAGCVSDILQSVHHTTDIERVMDDARSSMHRAIDPYISQAYAGIKASDIRGIRESVLDVKTIIPFTFPAVNKVNKGRAEGNLTLWGAYSSDGKSSVAISEAIASAKRGFKTALVTLEMTDDEVISKILSQLTGISLSQIDTGILSMDESALIDKAYDEIDKLNLTIFCDSGIEPSDVEAIQYREKFDLMLIDYLQRFEYKEYRELTSITRRFKNLALNTKKSIDLFAQTMPREAGMNKNPFTKPDIHSIFGGKGPAHESNNILFIWAHRAQDSQGGWNHRTGDGTLIVAKARMGKAGLEVPIRFDQHIITWGEQ